ncbi:VOC family protein [Chitiniphilus shinanonensis]|uniref:VOC family protein n=1 Tax=Chitiniphilus shinanonensis TaxID=553088 RepID=A0ABQ6BUA8_9NEIS|nr:VOC family protein [Chitiniphilus shinanonensis]GLS05059.1 VOC family protein [Chitiniphilus shinanonensis]
MNLLLSPYITFKGNCAEAMRYYESALGGTLTLLTVAGSPAAEHLPHVDGNLIMHAHLELPGGNRLLASDWMEGCGAPYEGIKGISLALTYDNVDEATRRFNALADGGQITMPLQRTFWVEQFGMLVDRYSICWLVNGGAKNQS